MHDLFVLHAGSVPGSHHTLTGQPRWHNNQDAYDLYRSDDMSIAVVCDGCSAGGHSEVGAHLIAQLTTQQIRRMVSAGRLPDHSSADDQSEGPFWQMARENVLAEIRVLANKMGDDLLQTVHDYFLTTVIGVLVLPETTYVFAIGDGFCSVNGQQIDITAPAGNTPPYMAYALRNQSSFSKTELQFTVSSWQTKEVDSVILGSDGVAYMPDVSDQYDRADQTLSLHAFVENDQYAENPDAIRRTLAAANSASTSPDKEGRIEAGPLKDDTTIVLLSRNKTQRGDSNEDTD